MADQDVDLGNDFTPTDDDPRELKLRMEKEELDGSKRASEDDENKASEEPKADAESSDKPDEGDTGAKEADAEDDKNKEDVDDNKRSKVIPRERFDKAQEKAKAREEALKAKIEDLEKQTSAHRMSADVKQLSKTIEELQDKYEDAVLDGKKAEAKSIRQELARLQDVMIEVKTNVSSEAAKREAIEELKYDAALAKAEADHPELNPDADEYDPGLTDEVGVLLESFVLRGFKRDVALQKAVRYVVGVPAKKDPDNVDPKRIADERARAAREKAKAAMDKQPAAINKVGSNSDKHGTRDASGIDIMRLSQDRFAKLDEETLSKMRGDQL